MENLNRIKRAFADAGKIGVLASRSISEGSRNGFPMVKHHTTQITDVCKISELFKINI